MPIASRALLPDGATPFVKSRGGWLQESFEAFAHPPNARKPRPARALDLISDEQWMYAPNLMELAAE